jgi:hypothetical protein
MSELSYCRSCHHVTPSGEACSWCHSSNVGVLQDHMFSWSDTRLGRGKSLTEQPDVTRQMGLQDWI